MKINLSLLKTTLLVAALALFASAPFAGTLTALEEEGGGSCKPPKDTQCLSGHPALGDWTPALE